MWLYSILHHILSFLSLSHSLSLFLSLVGSGCNASGTNSDEGDTSDDQTDYKKISCHGYSNKNIYSGSTYEYKTFPANSSSNCKSMIQVLCPDSFLPDTTSINSSSGYAIQEKQQHPIKSDLQKVSFPPHTNTIEFNVTGDSKDLSEKDKSFLIPTAHDEALLSMMSFFSHCHQVESAKII